jgi:hypothetical protein
VDIGKLWLSQPSDWQPYLDQWAAEYPRQVKLHAWRQFGGQQVRGLTLGDDGRERPIRLLAAVPHANEPAPTVALVDLAAQLITGKHLDGSASQLAVKTILEQCLLTLLPDTNSQGRLRSSCRAWDGSVDNEEFLRIVFGETARGERFGRHPEWRMSDHRPRKIGIIFEQLDEDLWVEPNTSRRSTHAVAIDELFGQYRHTHFLEMHQTERDEVVFLPATFEEQSSTEQQQINNWARAILQGWERAGMPHRGSRIPYRGQPRQEQFRAAWSGRCPSMIMLLSETRNNRHEPSGQGTSLEHQYASATCALESTLQHLLKCRIN